MSSSIPSYLEVKHRSLFLLERRQKKNFDLVIILEITFKQETHDILEKFEFRQRWTILSIVTCP